MKLVANTMILIAMTGAKFSGKTSASDILVNEHGFVRLRFADALKSMLRSIGLTEAQIDGDEKELPCIILGGKTPRWAMQTLGTEWGRDLIDSHLWINIVREQIIRLASKNIDVRIVLDDCRFPNEHTLLKHMGATIWAIRRNVVEPKVCKYAYLLSFIGIGKRQHASEQHWKEFAVQQHVYNNLTKNDLHRNVSDALKLWFPNVIADGHPQASMCDLLIP